MYKYFIFQTLFASYGSKLRVYEFCAQCIVQVHSVDLRYVPQMSRAQCMEVVVAADAADSNVSAVADVGRYNKAYLLLRELALRSEVVLVCRATPLQKAAVVDM